MAYGKGVGKDKLKRMARLGMVETTPELAALRLACLDAAGKMAKAVWPSDVLDPVMTRKEMDSLLMPVQSACSASGLNNVWAEKMRLMAKPAVTEQWKRAQATLFGKFKNIAAMGDPDRRKPGQLPRLLNLPEGWTEQLPEADVTALQRLADGMKFQQVMELFRSLREGDAELMRNQANALRAMVDTIRLRYGIPEWRQDDAIIQLHLDYRCVRGSKDKLLATLGGFDEGLKLRRASSAMLPIASLKARGEPILMPFRLSYGLIARCPAKEMQRVSSLLLELGPSKTEAKAVITRLPTAKPVAGHTCVVAEDFGYAVTSSMSVIVSDMPISQAAVDRLGGHNGIKGVKKIGKREAKEFLQTHVAPATLITVETVQFDGRDFLDRLVHHADHVDRLRSEIDRLYNRIGRLRKEMNFLAKAEPDAVVPEVAPPGMCQRWLTMHGRFFRILSATAKLKQLRRGIYRTVDGLKTSWFGHVSTKKAELAEKHGVVVVREDLMVVTKQLDDPKYKGRTFNRMINNGSKGQYIRRSDDKLAWRGIPHIKVPSYYTSSTDTRVAKVDGKQRKGKVFKAALDGARSDADLHAAETIGHYLFLVPKAEMRLAA